MLAPVESLVSIPDSLSDVDAAPLVFAGSSTYTALRRAGAMPGGLVAVQGIGGLGHLGIQFANTVWPSKGSRRRRLPGTADDVAYV